MTLHSAPTASRQERWSRTSQGSDPRVRHRIRFVREPDADSKAGFPPRHPCVQIQRSLRSQKRDLYDVRGEVELSDAGDVGGVTPECVFIEAVSHNAF